MKNEWRFGEEWQVWSGPGDVTDTIDLVYYPRELEGDFVKAMITSQDIMANSENPRAIVTMVLHHVCDMLSSLETEKDSDAQQEQS